MCNGSSLNWKRRGYVTRAHQGRRNYYEVHADLPLRHPSEQHHQVSALLSLVHEGQVTDRKDLTCSGTH